MNFSRRFSLTGDLSHDTDTDNGLSGLYPSLDVLEDRCGRSLKMGSSYTFEKSSTTSGGNPNNRNGMTSSSTTTTNNSNTTFEEVAQILPAEYWTEEFDPIPLQLTEVSSWREDEIVEKFMSKIEGTDGQKDAVMVQLMTKVDENYDNLMACMSKVQNINVESCEAELLVKHGRMKINKTKQIFAQGSMKITKLQQKRDRLQQVLTTIDELKELTSLRHSLTTSLKMGEVNQAADYASTMLLRLATPRVQGFHALHNLSQSMFQVIQNIRNKTHRSLKNLCCRKFVVEEYERIVKAYLVLDDIATTHTFPSSSSVSSHHHPHGHGHHQHHLHEEVDGEDEFDEFDCMDGLAERINRFQLEDIDAVLHQSAMEFVYVGQQKKLQKAGATESGSLSPQGKNANANDFVDLADLPLAQLCKRIPVEMLPLCIVKSCSMLIDVVHTHFLITQWHSSPFDQRNYDMNFLHSKESESNNDNNKTDKTELGRSFLAISKSLGNDTTMDVEGFDELDAVEYQELTLAGVHRGSSSSATSTNAGNNKDDQNQRQWQEIQQRFEEVFAHKASPLSNEFIFSRLIVALNKLTKTKSLLWEEIITGLTSMLRNVVFTSALKLDEIVLMIRSLKIVIALGKEFCGSSSSILANCIDTKLAEYFNHFHMESFQILRTMLEAESWHNIFIMTQQTNQDDGHGDYSDLSSLFKSYLLRDSILSSSGVGKGVSGSSESKDSNDSNSELIRNALRDLLMTNHHSSTKGSKDHTKPTEEINSRNILSGFATIGNPLRLMVQDAIDNYQSFNDCAVSVLIDQEKVGEPIRKYLRDGLNAEKSSSSSANSSFVVTQSLLNGLLKYTVKYLDAMILVPEHCSVLFTTLCDFYEFYVSDIFHSFVPESERDKFFAMPNKMTAQPPDSQRDFQDLRFYLTAIYSCQNAEGSYLMKPFLPRFTAKEAFNDGSEGSQPILLRENSVIGFGDASNMQCLNERIVAAESCWFASQLLQETKSLMKFLLPDEQVKECELFSSTFTQVCGQLRSLLYKATANMLVQDVVTATQIAESGWDSRKMREEPFEWVETLVKFSGQAWECIKHMEGFGDSAALVREQMWIELCQSAFDVVLEGHSKVRKCSAEGRAAMTMNVFALHDGLNSIHLCRPSRGKHYIDNFLKAFYLSEDEMMNWIRDNYQAYPYRHVHNLLSQTMSSMLNSKKLRDAITTIDGLYEYEGSSTDSSQNLSSIANRFTGRNWRS